MASGRVAHAQTRAVHTAVVVHWRCGVREPTTTTGGMARQPLHQRTTCKRLFDLALGKAAPNGTRSRHHQCRHNEGTAMPRTEKEDRAGRQKRTHCMRSTKKCKAGVGLGSAVQQPIQHHQKSAAQQPCRTASAGPLERASQRGAGALGATRQHEQTTTAQRGARPAHARRRRHLHALHPIFLSFFFTAAPLWPRGLPHPQSRRARRPAPAAAACPGGRPG